MKTLIALLTLGSLAFAGEKQLFNGKDLTGWRGFTELWSVKDGCITGQTQPDPANPGKSTLKSNTFLVWDGEVADFELTFNYKIVDKDGAGVEIGRAHV